MIKPLLVILAISIHPISVLTQMPLGSIARYTLDNTANDISGNNYHGSLTSTTATANRFGSANKATAFSAGIASGTLPVELVTALQNNFTVGFWFKTNMTAPAGAQWYQGIAMLDAEACGVTNDWGISLMNNGKLSLGIGNPDITILSATDYNNNNWHFATAVRNTAAGSITLYVNGIQVASSTGTNTGPLNASGFLGLGKNFCNPSPLFTGSLDDIIAYDRALTGTEVMNLYNFQTAFVLPVRWVSFTADRNTEGVKLNWKIEQQVDNDRFEVEYSTNGIEFTMFAQIAASAHSQATSLSSYSVVHKQPKNGVYYYRVKQLDKDNRFSYSNIISITISSFSAGINLLSTSGTNHIVLLNPDRKMIREVVWMEISGKIVKKWEVNSASTRLQTSIQGLLAGSYIVQVYEGDGKIFTMRYIKQ